MKTKVLSLISLLAVGAYALIANQLTTPADTAASMAAAKPEVMQVPPNQIVDPLVPVTMPSTQGIAVQSIQLQPQVRYQSLTPELNGHVTAEFVPTPKRRTSGYRYQEVDPELSANYKQIPGDDMPEPRSLVSSFDAGGQDTNIVNNGGFLFIPADPHGAAGPNHVVNVFNTSIEFYQTDGTANGSQSLENFFAPLAPANFTFDPKVLFDQYEQRFVVVTLERQDTAGGDPTNSSRALVAVSDDADPNGIWYMQAIDTNVNIGGTQTWFDYPGFAVDEEVIYLNGNQFSYGASNVFQGVRLWVIDKTGFYAGAAATVVGPLDPYGGGGAATTTQPAHTYGTPPAGMGTYLMSYSRLAAGTTEFWQTVRIDNPLGVPTFSQQFLPVGDVEPNGGILPSAPQSGTAQTVATNDPRALDAVWRDGQIFAAATLESQSELGETSASWWVFDGDGLTPITLDDFGIIDGEDIATGTFTFFPSIAVNADGGIGVGFSASASSIFPSSYFAVRSPDDPAGTIRSSQLVRAGTDFYIRTFGGPRNRWGDYTSVAVDPNDECFWVYNKHAVTRGVLISGEEGMYGTAFGEFCNQAPVGNSDSIAVDQGATTSVLVGGATSVLNNDSDPDSDDSITATLDTGPNHASSFTLNTNGTFSYTHNGSANFTDSFTYLVCDDGTPIECTNTLVSITINNTDTPPTAVADASTVSEDSGANTIDVLDNDTDPDGGPIAIGSVTQPSNGTVVITNGGADLTYEPDANYCNDGSPTDDFTYTLNGGSSATVAMTVTCVDDAPTAVADAATVNEDSGVNTIDVLDNDNNTDGGPITVNSVTQPGNGTVVITNGGADLTYQPSADYCNDGSPTDDFTYTLNGGSSTTVAVSVTCVEDDPTAVNDAATVAEDSGATTVDVLDNDTDPDGGTLIVASVTQPSNGAVVITNGGADLTYQPSADYCNGGSPTDDFTYTLNGGSSATVAMTVTCVDDAPSAVADAATVNEDSGVSTIDVLNNDNNADGGPITIISVTQPTNGTAVITGGGAQLTYEPDANFCNDGSPTDDFTYTLNGGSSATVAMTVTCVDDAPTAVADAATVNEDSGASTIDVLNNDNNADGGPISIASVTQPSNGAVVITTGGADLTYQPSADYCNDGSPTDDFTYTLNGGSSTTVAVTVTCVDDIPTAVDDAFAVAEDSALNALDVLANDNNADGGPMTIASVTQPANGSVVNFGGNLSYTPDASYCNDGSPTDNFTYTLNGGSTATVVMTVTCDDDAPTAVDDSAVVSEDSVGNVIDVLGNDIDTDGGPMTVDSVTQPSNGAVTNNGNNVTYTPNADYCNNGSPTDNFTYTLNGGSTATVSMTVSCVDDDPTAVDDSATVAEDAGVTSINVLNNDTDPDGGPMTIASVTQPANGSVINSGNILSYTPDANYCNDGSPTDDFTYSLNGGSTATVAVTVTCVDDAPTANDDSATVSEDSSGNIIDVLGNDTDSDGGPITVASVTQPSNGSVINNGSSVSYSPDADYCNGGAPTDDFTYTLNGGSSATVEVTVICGDDDPTAVDDNATVLEDSGANVIDVLANDTDPDGGTMTITAVTQPANGVVVNNGSNVSYEPDAEFCYSGAGTDDFTYTLNGGSSATVSMTVTCVNDEPSMSVNSSVYVNLSDIAAPPAQNLACQFDFGPDNEDATQAVNDMVVSIQNDPDGILSSIDVDNNGALSYTFSGNQGVAEVTVALQDDGGLANGGDDTSVSYTFMVNVQDYVFLDDFEAKVCP